MSLTVKIYFACSLIVFSSCEKEEEGTSVMDIDGNTYKTVTIGNQTWMAENLRTTTYKDGTPITHEEDKFAWRELTTEAYCWYNNDETTYGHTYGAIYNYYAVETQNLCPDGWHVATHDEWDILREYLSNNGHAGNEGIALKAKTGWEGNGNGTDDYGFSALPSGVLNGSFDGIGYSVFWWVTGQATDDGSIAKYLSWEQSDIHQIGINKSVGYSVRCVSD